MKLPRIKTADQDLSRVQDNLAKVIEPFLAAYGLFGKQYRLAEGPWPTASSPICTQLQRAAASTWTTVAAMDPRGRFVMSWSTPTLLNSFTSLGSGFAPARYFVGAAGYVQLGGTVVNAPGCAANTVIFTLPVGYRPLYRLAFPSLRGPAPISTRVDVDASGNVFPTEAVAVGDFRTLDGIIFEAEQ